MKRASRNASQDKPYHLCFETLSNQLRLQILEMLSKRPMNVTELAALLHAERSRVSHSLQMLRICSYVDAKKQGKEVVYTLRDGTPLGAQRPGNSVFAIVDNHIDEHCKGCNKLRMEKELRMEKTAHIGVMG